MRAHRPNVFSLMDRPKDYGPETSDRGFPQPLDQPCILIRPEAFSQQESPTPLSFCLLRPFALLFRKTNRCHWRNGDWDADSKPTNTQISMICD